LPARFDHGQETPQHLSPGVAVVDAEKEVSANIWCWSLAQSAALDVVQLEFHGCNGSHGVLKLPAPSGAPVAAEDRDSAAPDTGKCELQASSTDPHRR
jgi:hypothetical protein